MFFKKETFKAETMTEPLPTLVDFHSHILPGMDDGSSSCEESARMLTAAAEQGLSAVIATPHFYPEREPPEEFLARRNAAEERLKTVLQNGNYPSVYLGAEVAYYNGISFSSQISDLTIRGTDVLLVEMPFCKWNDRVIGEICALHSSRGLIPVIAHIERYPQNHKRQIFETLLDDGVLIQSNAEAFLSSKNKEILSLVEEGVVRLLGSDCHNCEQRPQNLGGAFAEILKKPWGSEALSEVSELESFLLKKAIPVFIS